VTDGPASSPQVSPAAWLDALASRTPAPSGGAAAAVTLAAAGSLAAMVASYSVGSLEDAGALLEAAERLRRRALELAAEDQSAYAAVLSLPAGPPRTAAYLEAARVPLRMVELAAELAPILAELATRGKQALRGDALSGFRLLEGAAAAAAGLVRIDVEALPPEERGSLLGSLERTQDSLRAAAEGLRGR